MRSRYNHRNRRKYDLKAHIVLVTKYRKALLQNGIDDFVKRAICYLAKQNNRNIIAMKADKDHIHVPLEYDTTECICNIISVLKMANNTLPVDSIQNISCQILLEEAYLLV